MDVEKIVGKKGVRIVSRERYQETELLTMRNGFQWSGCPVDRELLAMVRDAINEFLGSTQETSPAPAERTVWTKTSDSDPYCIHCGRTWDMHICDGRSSCPTSNR